VEDINNVTLVARLTRAPEMKGSILPLRLAFTTRQKNGEQWGDKSNYIDAIVFGRSAEALAPMLDKGTRVVVAGNLEWREFTDREGNERSTVQLLARSVQIVSGYKEGGGTSAATSADGGGRASEPEPGYGSAPAPDDIPF
jgi:single-strand DNA-binding protein